MRQGLGSSAGFSHLPSQAGEGIAHTLAKDEVGAGQDGGSRRGGRSSRRSDNGGGRHSIPFLGISFKGFSERQPQLRRPIA
jgi:hypothetical protein